MLLWKEKATCESHNGSKPKKYFGQIHFPATRLCKSFSNNSRVILSFLAPVLWRVVWQSALACVFISPYFLIPLNAWLTYRLPEWNVQPWSLHSCRVWARERISGTRVSFFFFFGWLIWMWKMLISFFGLLSLPSVSRGKHLCQNWILVTARVILAHVHRLFPPLRPWLTAGARCDGPWAGPWAELTRGDKQPLWLIQLGVRLGWLWTVRGCPRSHAEKAPRTHKTPPHPRLGVKPTITALRGNNANRWLLFCVSFLPIVAVKTGAGENMFSSHFFFFFSAKYVVQYLRFISEK